ncbi:hypothetical protein X975_23199, partial [Stegodyphus mimosarum]
MNNNDEKLMNDNNNKDGDYMNGDDNEDGELQNDRNGDSIDDYDDDEDKDDSNRIKEGLNHQEYGGGAVMRRMYNRV